MHDCTWPALSIIGRYVWTLKTWNRVSQNNRRFAMLEQDECFRKLSSSRAYNSVAVCRLCCGLMCRPLPGGRARSVPLWLPRVVGMWFAYYISSRVSAITLCMRNHCVDARHRRDACRSHHSRRWNLQGYLGMASAALFQTSSHCRQESRKDSLPYCRGLGSRSGIVHRRLVCAVIGCIAI